MRDGKIAEVREYLDTQHVHATWFLPPPDDRTVVHEWFEEVWNKGDRDAIERLFAADGIAHGLAGDPDATMQGPAGYLPLFDTFRGAFPDIHIDVVDTVRDGDKIAARCVVRGTHLGDGLGIGATNRRVEFTGMTLLRVRDGQIVEAWNNFDFPRMYQQLGVSAS
jgi:steroid delta-isomerase-like uncharacterized protein